MCPGRYFEEATNRVLGPQAYYERVGDVSGVVFPSGAVIHKESNQLYLYYGAADSSVAVAVADLDEVQDYIMSCPEVED